MAKTKTPTVELWAGHDVNLTIPTEYGGISKYQLAQPTLADIRDFVRAATDAGYDDNHSITVGVGGLSVRRGGVS